MSLFGKEPAGLDSSHQVLAGWHLLSQSMPCCMRRFTVQQVPSSVSLWASGKLHMLSDDGDCAAATNCCQSKPRRSTHLTLRADLNDSFALHPCHQWHHQTSFLHGVVCCLIPFLSSKWLIHSFILLPTLRCIIAFSYFPHRQRSFATR